MLVLYSPSVYHWLRSSVQHRRSRFVRADPDADPDVRWFVNAKFSHVSPLFPPFTSLVPSSTGTVPVDQNPRCVMLKTIINALSSYKL